MHLKYFKQQVNHFAIFLNYCSGCLSGWRDFRLPSVTIGDGAVDCMGRVITKGIQEKEVAAGNPCRIIRPVNGSSVS